MNSYFFQAITLLTSVVLMSCSKEDPSVAKEGERKLAEALTEKGRLMAQLKTAQTRNEQLRQERDALLEKIEGDGYSQMPSPEELRSGFVEAAFRWEEEVKKDNPAYQVKLRSFAEPEGPSMEFPFRCSGTFVLRGPTGELKDIHWNAKGTPNGEWTFSESDDAAGALLAENNNQHNRSGSGSSTSEQTSSESNQSSMQEENQLQQRIRKLEEAGHTVIDTTDPDNAIMGPGRR